MKVNNDIPDPMEIIKVNQEILIDRYIDEHTCMGCAKKVDYELMCADFIGMGPALCAECLGIEIGENIEESK